MSNSPKTLGDTTLSRKSKLPNFFPFKQTARPHFHPGASSLGDENTMFGKGKQVTSREMMRAMLNYVWPKVNICPAQFMICLVFLLTFVLSCPTE